MDNINNLFNNENDNDVGNIRELCRKQCKNILQFSKQKNY